MKPAAKEIYQAAFAFLGVEAFAFLGAVAFSSAGAKTVMAPGWTMNFAGVEVTISPSVLTGMGRFVSISNSTQRAVRTSFHAPCLPERKARSMPASFQTLRISRL